MEHPPLPNPDQQRMRWQHHFMHPNVVELPVKKEVVGHDPIIDGLGFTAMAEVIEFPVKEELPDEAA